MRNKIIINDTWKEQHCKSCLWLVNGALCPFKRCPKVFGWSADRKATERILEGKNDE